MSRLRLLLPAVALPLYLIARMYGRRDRPDDSTTAPADAETGELPSSTSSDGDGDSDGDDAETGVEAPALSRSRLALPFVYLTAVLLVGGLYFYRDYMSFDAHFARARRAKLYNQRERAVRESRAVTAEPGSSPRPSSSRRTGAGALLARQGRRPSPS